MKNKEFSASWIETKGKLKQKFAFVTDSDLLLEASRKEEMIGRLQIKLNKTKEELQIIIAAL